MSTYTQILYQIVFTTRNRKKCLCKKDREKLLMYIYGILKSKECHLYRINAEPDHLHIITHIHPSVSLAALVKDIKLASTALIKKDTIFPGFNGWQDGYGAFTYSITAKNNLIEYVKNQEEHHKTKSFREELIDLLNEQGIAFDMKYMS